jgi:hypothetical protein
VLLIDSDILIYKAAAPSSCWKAGPRIFHTKTQAVKRLGKDNLAELVMRKLEPSIEHVIKRLDNLIVKIQNGVREKIQDTFLAGAADAYLNILSPEDGSSNFRHTLAKTQPYKGNRKDIVRPFHFSAARSYLIDNHKAIVTKNQEADDEIGIRQMQTPGSIVCTTDKDAFTYPGWKYNWDRNALVFVTDWDAEYNFYYQILCGDACDNIKGIDSMGPIGAKKLLDSAKTPKDMLECTVAACMVKNKKSREQALEYINEIGALLRIRREPEEIWSTEGVSHALTQ